MIRGYIEKIVKEKINTYIMIQQVDHQVHSKRVSDWQEKMEASYTAQFDELEERVRQLEGLVNI